VIDLDGTLVDTVGARIDAWMQTFDEEGIPADRAHVASLIGSDGRQLARTVGEAAGVDMDAEWAERIDARCGAVFLELNARPRPLPGVREFLDALDDAGIAWAIATSSRREHLGPSVASLQRNGTVVIVDGTAVQHAKPHPALLLAAASALQTPPAQCWCVGDSNWDMQAGTNAGMTTIAVTAGSAVTADQLRAAGADLVVTTMDELVPLIPPPQVPAVGGGG
jgi:phosphoglycolate phosphatase